jgi:hypothetical protein
MSPVIARSADTRFRLRRRRFRKRRGESHAGPASVAERPGVGNWPMPRRLSGSAAKETSQGSCGRTTDVRRSSRIAGPPSGLGIPGDQRAMAASGRDVEEAASTVPWKWRSDPSDVPASKCHRQPRVQVDIQLCRIRRLATWPRPAKPVPTVMLAPDKSQWTSRALREHDPVTKPSHKREERAVPSLP